MLKNRFLLTSIICLILQTSSFAGPESVYLRKLGLNNDDLNKFSQPRHSQVEYNLIPEAFRNHPEIGLIPLYEAPCDNCFELIDKRTETSRVFTKNGSGANHVFVQNSSSALHYLDDNGWWRDKDHRVQVFAPGVYGAIRQSEKFILDLNQKNAEVHTRMGKITFNRNIKLIHQDQYGTIRELGSADWSNYTAGDRGVRIINFYPGVDLIFSFNPSGMETSFILTRKPAMTGGTLIMVQEFDFQHGIAFEKSKINSGKRHDDFRILGNDTALLAIVERAYAFDNDEYSSNLLLEADLENGNVFSVHVPLEWLNDNSRKYPVVIDPVVTTQNTLPLASIAGTRFSAICWTNSCDYFLTVPTPANTTLTNVYSSFEYTASGLCLAQDGGFSIELSTCRYPQAAPGVVTCPLAITNFSCGILNNSMLPDLQSCLPAPQCAQQNLDFTLRFYRCNNDPDPSCGSACIRATQPWIVTVEGRTLELIAMSPTQQLCEGSSVNVIALPMFGVEPYTFAWSPAGVNNDTVSVSPLVNTTYTVNITDVCGNTSAGSSDVNVTPRSNPGFIAIPASPCTGQPLNLQGNGFAPVSSYDWTLPGSSASGGIVQDNKSPTVQYNVPGIYPVTLNFTSGLCVFDSTINLTVLPQAPAQVNLSANPAGAVCPGDFIRFLANTPNGGTAPNYDWYIDGTLVQSGSTDSLVSSAFVNGSLVQVVLTSNSSCTNPSIDTASFFVTLSNTVTPLVSISPDTAVCSGSNIVFTANYSNSGASPALQWFVNGFAVPGANGNTFSHNVVSPDTIIGIQLIPSLTCVTIPFASDSSYVNLLQPFAPSVNISSNPSGAVCTGDTIIFDVQANVSLSSAMFEWFINGVSQGGPSGNPTFTLLNPQHGDSVSVGMSSAHPCLLAPNASDYQLLSVLNAVQPQISLNATPSLNICQGDPLTINATTSGGGNNPAVNWYLNGVLVSQNQSSFSSSTFNDQDVLQAILISSLSCATQTSDSDLVIVNVTPVTIPSISISALNPVNCDGDTISFSAAIVNGGSGAAFHWEVNGMPLANNAPVFSYLAQSGDVIQAFLTPTLNCSGVSQVSSNVINVLTLPSVTPTASINVSPSDSICLGQTVNVNSSYTFGGSNPQLAWTINGLTVSSNTTSFSTDTLRQGDIIQFSMISNQACATEDTVLSNYIRIMVHPPVSGNIVGGGNLCPGSPVQLYAHGFSGNGGPYSFLWNHSLETSDQVTVSPRTSTNYSVQISDNCNILPYVASVNVPVLPGPVSGFNYIPSEPSTLNNAVQFYNTSQLAGSWQWLINDTVIDYSWEPNYIFNQPGEHVVKLITTNSTGCVDSVTYVIVVKEDLSYFFPTAFTPNGDLINDFWSPLGLSLAQCTFQIFDRWGQVIHEGDLSKPWDGRIKGGTNAPEGVYVFRVDLGEKKFDPREVVGRVVLLR